MGKHRWLLRISLAVSMASAVLAVAWSKQRALLPKEGCVAPGVVVMGVVAGTDQPIATFSQARTDSILNHRVRLQRGGVVLVEATLAELGATVDEAALRKSLHRIARSGSLIERLEDAQRAREGAMAVAVSVNLPAEALVAKLQDYKVQHDRSPVPARWDFSEQRPIPHENGVRVDSHAAVDAIHAALRAGKSELRLPVVEVKPRATSTIVQHIDRSKRVGEWKTRYGHLGTEAGRAQNIARAAQGIDGLALMPNQEVSFNALVGPRSIENGFAQAGEIYKGEMRMGIGGGTCQVASTLHAAAYLGGLDITERSPHSRPSGYIPMGLDATVAYPHVDFRLRNPFDFPIIVRAIAQQGTLNIQLFGAQEPSSVEWKTEAIAFKPFKRKVREFAHLEEGHVVRKQAGKAGATVRRFRRVEYGSRPAIVERSVDHYPPTTEIYHVPSGTDPAALPPLPGTT